MSKLTAKRVLGSFCLLTILALAACDDGGGGGGGGGGLGKIDNGDGGGNNDGGGDNGDGGNDRYEPNDRIEQATSVPTSGTLSATLQGDCDISASNNSFTCKPGSDQDFFTFSLTAAAQGVITLTSSSTTVDIDIYLFAQGGKILLAGNKIGTSEESITASLSAGTYGILVTPYNVPQAADYTLLFSQ